MKTIIGDITTVKEGIILHQVNAKGVMGSGVAKAIRNRWPQVYQEYRLQYEEGRLNLGSIHLVRINERLQVCNLVGQDGYGLGKQHTDYNAIITGLNQLRAYLDKHNLLSSAVHHPLLGCGLGGGDWGVVENLIETIIGTNTNLWILN